MATTNLTVTVDDDLLRRAEELASAQNMTVTKMIERLLRVVAQRAPLKNELPPVTRSALGMLPPLSNDEVKDILDEHRTQKYGSQ
jgi:antitoxin component of RelBE/YafQ-DinJ toxin-antitoxin module